MPVALSGPGVDAEEIPSGPHHHRRGHVHRGLCRLGARRTHQSRRTGTELVPTSRDSSAAIDCAQPARLRGHSSSPTAGSRPRPARRAAAASATLRQGAERHRRTAMPLLTGQATKPRLGRDYAWRSQTQLRRHPFPPQRVQLAGRRPPGALSRPLSNRSRTCRSRFARSAGRTSPTSSTQSSFATVAVTAGPTTPPATRRHRRQAHRPPGRWPVLAERRIRHGVARSRPR